MGTEASQELLRQEMASRQKPSPPKARNEPNVFESAQMDPFVAVSARIYKLVHILILFITIDVERSPLEYIGKIVSCH